MSPSGRHSRGGILKAPTGVEGLDALTGGGLPRGRSTVVVGGPGAGKTTLALQFLVDGARTQGEPGIFVAFEESRDRIVANVASFGWDLAGLERRHLLFLNAQPQVDMVTSGTFDLEGLLAALDGLVRRRKVKRIVFDAVDVVTALLDDPGARRRELFRLHEWLLARGLTAILTAKAGGEGDPTREPLTQLQFMVDCVVELRATMHDGLSHRDLRVLKFRGSDFVANESPLIIGERGMEVAGPIRPPQATTAASEERLSTGVDRLDTMLGGGYFRGSSTLITGSPGTAKSTLVSAFAAAACARGERTLFVSFDSEPSEILRNMASVAIDLRRHVRNRRLTLLAARSRARSADLHFLAIRRLARERGATCLVIDPISAFGKVGQDARTFAAVERLIDWARGDGLTLVCTSLLDGALPEAEASPLQVSTIADTWLHLNNLVHAGERNRALTVVKSRGTAHSNQVRELMLTSEGVSLSDVFVAGGEVLMGTMRWEHELRTQQDDLQAAIASTEARQAVDHALAELEGRARVLQLEIADRHAERRLLEQRDAARAAAAAQTRKELGRLRRADDRRRRAGP